MAFTKTSANLAVFQKFNTGGQMDIVMKIPEMECKLRDRLAEQNISVRKLAEQGESIPGTPSYSTIDNFIRKGTGHLDTAWSICKMIGITLDEAFVEKGSNNTNKELVAQTGEIQNVLKEIIELIICKREIRTVNEIADILLTIGTSISRVGYEEEAAKIIGIATDAIENSNQGGC